MQKCIEKSICGKTFEKHVIRPLFSVDNTRLSVDDGVEALQKKIMEVLEQEPYMGEEVPIRWFNFEKVVEELVAKKIYHMDLDRLKTVTKEVCRIDDEEELRAMLNFYHDLGVIVKHGRTVVLQAQWLIDLFKQLIVVRPFSEADPRYSEYWQELEQSGHLRMALVDHCFDKFIQKGLSKQDILNMMELYGLIAKFKDGVTDEQIYFVPAQLKPSPSGLCETELSDCDPCPLYLHFPDGFVPHGLFSQLLSRCISWCSEHGPKDPPNLFQNGARFFIGMETIYYLILICRKRFIKVMLQQDLDSSPAEESNASSERAREVLVFLEKTLQDMSDELSWLHGLQYKLCVTCTRCLKRTDKCAKHSLASCTHDDCLHLLELRPKRPMICRETFGHGPITPVGWEKWLPARETESEEQVSLNPEGTLKKRKREAPSFSSSKRFKHAPDHCAGTSKKRKRESPCSSSKISKHKPDHTAVVFKEGTPEDDDLEELGGRIPRHWKKLGRRLFNKNADAVIDSIDNEYKECPEKAYQMLLRWKQSKGSKATFCALYKALCHPLVKRQDLAVELCLLKHG
ncbi:hypothetical protein ACROYT_G031010 [Oculina patagonica]